MTPNVLFCFKMQHTNGSSLDDQMSSFSTDDVDIWRYAAVCCMPETTTTTQIGNMSAWMCTAYAKNSFTMLYKSKA